MAFQGLPTRYHPGGGLVWQKRRVDIAVPAGKCNGGRNPDCDAGQGRLDPDLRWGIDKCLMRGRHGLLASPVFLAGPAEILTLDPNVVFPVFRSFLPPSPRRRLPETGPALNQRAERNSFPFTTTPPGWDDIRVNEIQIKYIPAEGRGISGFS